VCKRCDDVNLRDMELDFEIPFRELGFMGVPHRQTAFVMPTVNCLVELVEMPFTVVTMGEVNIVNLERVGFNLRNFDMTLVFKVCFSCCIWSYYQGCGLRVGLVQHTAYCLVSGLSTHQWGPG
jgi:hypothetical protein